jgi:2-amino-4-hydroxy-6-hydroxymethyldihydropteridine diphosphokinase/dihydropteroate synthase
MGRVKVIDKGPRNIDLDIAMFESPSGFVPWDDERLILPHKLMFERQFVLRPLYEYVIVPHTI